MSDHIAHLGICDDTFRLAPLLGRVPERLTRIMDSHRESAHMGSITRYADKWTAQLVHWAREEDAKDPVDRDPLLDDKLAFMLGSLTHRAADRLTKPITKCWPGKDATADQIASADGAHANESKIMQDLFVFREVYNHGQGDPQDLFSPAVLKLPDTDAAQANEMVYRTLLRRALIAMHTINPDADNVHDWMHRFFKGMQQYPKSLEQYRSLAEAWDPAKVKMYLTDKHFYESDDDLIRLARSIQRGESVESEEVQKAYDAIDADHSTQQSRYARALAKALDYLVAAGEAFGGEIDERETAQRFDIGVPELSLQE
jgi:hypothetical protein